MNHNGALLPMPMRFKELQYAPEAVCTIRVDMPFDFRSQRFEDDALHLIALTGQSLEACRQALFLAEGDVDEARAALESGYRPFGADYPLQ